jgi:hypothetical protein
MSKQSTGIGATVDPSPLGGFVVKAVTDTGTAKKAGILVADRITAVDGQSVVESSVEKLRSLLLGEPSSPIEVQIIRGDQSLTLKFNRNPPLNAAAALPPSTSTPTPVAVVAPHAAAPSPPLPSSSHTNDMQQQPQQQQQQQQQPQQHRQQEQQLEAASRSKALGNSAFSAGKFEEAIEHFTSAISLEPSNHVHYSNRSVSYAKLGKPHAALSDANKCTRLCPSFSKGWFRLGVANDMLGRYSDAIAALEQGLAIEPGHQQMEAALARARSLVSGTGTAAAAAAAQAATAGGDGGDNIQQQLQRLEEPLIAYVKEGGGGASARRLQEEEEWLAKLGISFKNEQERSKVLAAAKVQRELDSASLESEVAAAEHFEWKRSRTEAAKFLAVKQHMDYDGFKNLVDGATLTSIKPQQGEDIHSITAEKRHIVFNKEAVGARGSVSGEDGQETLALGLGRGVSSGKELEKLWRRCNGKADEQWSLLAGMHPAALPSVFLQEQDASLVDGIVASCATALAQASNTDRVCVLLQHLVKSKRFKLTWAMVDGSTKAHARHIVSSLQPTHAAEAEALEAALLKA